MENCKVPITEYFTKYKKNEEAFGFIPELSTISKARTELEDEKEELSSMKTAADEFVQTFQKYVNVESILNAATRIKMQELSRAEKGIVPTRNHKLVPTVSKQTNTSVASTTSNLETFQRLSREQIESAAKFAGAGAG